MAIEISIAVIALAFLVLVIGIIIFLNSLRATLKQVNQTMIIAREQFDGMACEAKKIIEHTHQISADIQQKMESMNPFFKSAENLGEILEEQTTSLKESYEVCSDVKCSARCVSSRRQIQPTEKRATTYALDQVADIVELASLGIRLWQKLKERR